MTNAEILLLMRNNYRVSAKLLKGAQTCECKLFEPFFFFSLVEPKGGDI